MHTEKEQRRTNLGLGWWEGNIYLGYIFWILFKPLGIPGLEECGLTTPNFRPWNCKKGSGGENELNEKDLGREGGGIYSEAAKIGNRTTHSHIHMI